MEYKSSEKNYSFSLRKQECATTRKISYNEKIYSSKEGKKTKKKGC